MKHAALMHLDFSKVDRQQEGSNRKQILVRRCITGLTPQHGSSAAPPRWFSITVFPLSFVTSHNHITSFSGEVQDRSNLYRTDESLTLSN